MGSGYSVTPQTEYLKIIFISVYVCVCQRVCATYMLLPVSSEEGIGASVAGIDR